MAGLSSRFTKAGYKTPKYMLQAHGKTLFEWSILSFKKYFSTEDFLFIIRDISGTKAFVKNQIHHLGLKKGIICTLDAPTTGQAETVYLGLSKKQVEKNEPITVFNIDTFRPGFEFPGKIESYDGYLEVFKGSGTNWSYAKPENQNSTRVVYTAEKNEISDLCSTGLYYFKMASLFQDAYLNALDTPLEKLDARERYIAPLYNHLITNDYAIHYHLIDRNEVIFCGVPDEYTEFLKIETKPNE